MIANVIKKLFCFSVILLILVALPAIAEEKILVFGDSLSAGYGLKEKQGWVSLLQTKLNHLNYNTKLTNASISSETTLGGANKIQKALQLYQPDIILIALGGNDGLRGLSLNAMFKNLETIIKAAKKSNAKILLIGMKIPPNYGIKYTQQFSDSYKKLALQYQTAFVPFLLEGVGGNPLLMQKDGLHANAIAQPKILDNVWPELSLLLTKSK